MRMLIFVLLLMFISCPAFADDFRSTGLIDVLKSPQFTIQFITDGRKRIVGGVTITPYSNSVSKEKVTLVKDGDKEFVSVETNQNGKNKVRCYLKDKDWCYLYEIYDGSFHNRASSLPSSSINVIEKKELLLAETYQYGFFRDKYQPFVDYYNNLLQYIGITSNTVDYTKTAEPLSLNGNYYASGQETINDVTYEYDEYRDDSTPKFVAKNRYYYKDGRFDRFISLGDGFEMEFWKYANLFLYPGRITVVDLGEPKSMTNVVQILQFSNTVEPGVFDFPANVKIKEVLIEKLMPPVMRNRKTYENKSYILAADKQRQGERQKKILQAIKGLLQ